MRVVAELDAPGHSAAWCATPGAAPPGVCLAQRCVLEGCERKALAAAEAAAAAAAAARDGPAGGAEEPAAAASREERDGRAAAAMVEERCRRKVPLAPSNETVAFLRALHGEARASFPEVGCVSR